jgi:integrase
VARRRARGTGSIFRKTVAGLTVWVARGPGGKPEVTGRTQAEAIRKLALARPPGEDCTVGEWAGRWRRTWTTRASTRHGAGVDLDKHLIPALGSRRIRSVTAADVERLAADLGSALAPGTVAKVVGTLRALFGAAVRAGLVPNNPVSQSRKPRRRRPTVETYTPAELAAVIRTAPRYAAGGAVAVLAATGMRVGEVLALDVPDYTPSTGELRITKTYSLRFGLGPPKSERGNRTVRVPAAVRDVLGRATGNRTAGPLFPTRAGKRRPAQTVAKCWRAIVKACGLVYRKPHALRHSAATAMIGAGVPVSDVAAYLGDTVETVVKTYLHPTGADPSAALDRLYGGGEGDSGEEIRRKSGGG